MWPTPAMRTEPSATTAGPRPGRSRAPPPRARRTRRRRWQRSPRGFGARWPGSRLCGAKRSAEPLDLHDHGQHHRPALGALVQERCDAVVDRVLERGRLGEVLTGLRLGQTLENSLLRELDHLGAVVLRDEALGHDVR